MWIMCIRRLEPFITTVASVDVSVWSLVLTSAPKNGALGEYPGRIGDGTWVRRDEDSNNYRPNGAGDDPPHG